MALRKLGKYWYGDGREDIPDELRRYGKLNGYVPTQFAESRCRCGGHTFRLRMDETEGAAIRICTACRAEHPIGDSDEYLDEADLEAHECMCGRDVFEIVIGVSLYDGNEAVRWLYVGCRCSACGLTGCFGDWKNEFEDYRQLLARV